MLAVMLLLMAGQEADARTKLAGTLVDAAYEDVPLAEAVEDVLRQAGMALADRGGLNGERVTLRMKGVTARTALRQLLGPRGLTLRARGMTASVVPYEKAHPVEVRVYDIRDLALKPADFEGPSLELRRRRSAADG
jgi:hypothetical protein